MTVRSALGSLQLPIALGGALVLVWAVVQLATLPEPQAGSDGFPQGLAVLFLYVLAWAGFTASAVGFAIPPGAGYGIRFTVRQRRLFAVAAVSAIVSAVLPFVAFGLLFAASMEGNWTVVLLAWGVPAVGAVVGYVGALGWRAGQAVVPRVRERGE